MNKIENGFCKFMYYVTIVVDVLEDLTLRCLHETCMHNSPYLFLKKAKCAFTVCNNFCCQQYKL